MLINVPRFMWHAYKNESSQIEGQPIAEAPFPVVSSVRLVSLTSIALGPSVDKWLNHLIHICCMITFRVARFSCSFVYTYFLCVTNAASV